MSIFSENELKNFFRNFLKPDENKFWAIFSSFRHKSEKITTSDLDADIINAINNSAAGSTGNEKVANKGVANGYTPLGADAKVPDNYLSNNIATKAFSNAAYKPIGANFAITGAYLQGTIIHIKYTNDAGLETDHTIDIASAFTDIHLANAALDPNSYVLTITSTDGTSNTVNLYNLLKVAVTDGAFEIQLLGDGSPASPLYAKIKQNGATDDSVLGWDNSTGKWLPKSFSNLTSGFEKTANKNQPNGYMGLGANGKALSGKISASDIVSATSGNNKYLSATAVGFLMVDKDGNVYINTDYSSIDITNKTIVYGANVKQLMFIGGGNNNAYLYCPDTGAVILWGRAGNSSLNMSSTGARIFNDTGVIIGKEADGYINLEPNECFRNNYTNKHGRFYPLVTRAQRLAFLNIPSGASCYQSYDALFPHEEGVWRYYTNGGWKYADDVKSLTWAQRTSITNPYIGLHIWQTDGTVGMYVYGTSGWYKAY